MKFLPIVDVFLVWTITMQCCSAHVINCPLVEESPLIESSMVHEISEKFTYHGNSFELTCTAAYPIEWDYDGDLPKVIATVKRTRHRMHSKSSCYESALQIYVTSAEGFSVTFICSSIKDPVRKRSSFHKFFAGRIGAIFSTSIPRQVKRAQKTKEGHYVIPCRSNYEHVNASLAKVLNETQSNATHLNIPISYDPKVGFVLQTSDPIGEYECLASSESSSYSKSYAEKFEVEIEILGTEDTVSFSPESEFPSFQNGSGLHLVCESVHEIYLNTTGVPNEFKGRGSIAHVPESKFPHTAEMWINSTGNSKGRVSCHRKDTNAVIMTWEFNEANRCKCIWDNWLKKKRGDLLDPNGLFICSPGSKASQNSFHCSNPSECRLTQSNIKDDCLIKTCSIFHNFGPYSSQLLHNGLSCDVEILSELKSAPNHESFIESIARSFESDIRSGNLISIEPENSRRVFRAGESYPFVCKFHSNILAQEILWGIEMKNGSFTYLTENEGSVRGILPSIYGSSSYQAKHTVKIQILDLNVCSVFCFASVWATGEIVNASVEVYVHESVVIVEDPKNCIGISGPPSIILNARNPSGIFQFYNVTGKDFITDDDHYIGQPKLICVSTYLAEWTFNGLNFSTSIQAPSSSYSKSHGLSTKEMLRIPNRNQNGPRFCFINTVTIHLSSSSTIGNYTCRELRKDGKESSVYLFIKSDSKFDLIGHGTHETLTVNKSQEWTAIPCRANDPEAEIHLIRQDYEGNMYTLCGALNSSTLKPYNPKEGFFIKTFLLHTVYNESDIYVCSSVQKGMEDNEVNHVKTYGLRFEEIVTKTNEEQVDKKDDDGNFESKLFPWLCVLLLLFLIGTPGICFYIWKQREQLTASRASTTLGSVLFLNNDNANVAPKDVAERQSEGGTDYGFSFRARDTEGGIKNRGYSQFE